MELESKNAKEVLDYVWGFSVKLIQIVDGKEKEITSTE